jgi:outer membrane biosynthesis protein TonB
MTSGPEPGWYPDPLGSDQQRWWDGRRWTASLRPMPADRAANDVTQQLPPVAGLQPVAVEDTATAGGRGGWVWVGAAAAVLAVALGVGVGLAFRGTSDEGTQPVAADASLGTEAATERPVPVEDPIETDTVARETEETEAEAEAAEPTEEATEGTKLEPPPPVTEEPETEPETEPATARDTEPPAGTDAASGSGSGAGGTPPPAAGTVSSRPSSAELTAAAGSYVAALDRGDLRTAHDHLTPSMQQRPGWTLGEFTDFWDGYLLSAGIVSFDQVDDVDGTVRVTVDYALQSGDLARESLVMTFIRGADGRALMDDYEVLRSVWNP